MLACNVASLFTISRVRIIILMASYFNAGRRHHFHIIIVSFPLIFTKITIE